MNFEFSAEQQLLREQARAFLLRNCTSEDVRRILDGDEPYHPELWQGIADLGWLGASIPEAYGGLGLGHLELCVLAEELGRAVAPVPFSSSVYLFAEILMLVGSPAQKQRLLPRVATGELIGTLALSEAPGPVTPARINASVAGGRITGTKIPVCDGLAAQRMIVAARGGTDADQVGLFIVEQGASGLDVQAVSSIDPTRNFARVTFDATPCEPLGALGGGWSTIEQAFDRAAVLFAFEQLGGAEAALQMACDYARERYAFGRPIGSFQAIKHRLADLYVAVELARANCYYGAWALSTGAPELTVAAPTARISATEAYEACAKENIQVHGGMGFTWEFDCHLHYRRSKVLALALGAPSRWKDRLIDRLEARNVAI